MLASGTDRKPGFSVEGRALERDKNNPKKVTKALITNVAMTMTPVNANSFADIVKGVQTVDFVEDNKEEINNGSNNVLVEQTEGHLPDPLRKKSGRQIPSMCVLRYFKRPCFPAL